MEFDRPENREALSRAAVDTKHVKRITQIPASVFDSAAFRPVAPRMAKDPAPAAPR
jgi:hypothetical protein